MCMLVYLDAINRPLRCSEESSSCVFPFTSLYLCTCTCLVIGMHTSRKAVNSDSVATVSVDKLKGNRPDAANILIVLTDGQSVNQDATLQEAAALHNLNFNVLAVGVGNGVDYRELSAIASSPQNVFTVSNFEALATLEDTLERTACAATVPPPGKQHMYWTHALRYSYRLTGCLKPTAEYCIQT